MTTRALLATAGLVFGVLQPAFGADNAELRAEFSGGCSTTGSLVIPVDQLVPTGGIEWSAVVP